MEMDQLNLGIGTRLQHTQHGPGVIVGVRYATYLISFINAGVKEIEKTDTSLDEIIPENVTMEVETVSEVEKNSISIQVAEVIKEDEPALKFTLIQALAKGDRDELAIQAATELGVWEVIPWISARSVSVWEGKKLETGRARWQQIVQETAKQSLRSFIPEVGQPLNSKQVAAALNDFDLVLVLEPTASPKLSGVSIPSSGRVAILVGPEGGISPEELELFSNAVQVNLGANVLRTSTAGPAVLAALTLR